ncbi:B12-binding domain-containing radical SAM protein [Candidatus Woesearchaeota archaeon]|nr:B12-binding domain-containing radical SAM protein [Candidatus Woesearchaeota archaeon]
MDKKKILLTNPRRRTCMVSMPHMGLGILAAILKKAGHEVLVVDYQLRHKAPPLSQFLEEFKPDIVGIVMYTASVEEADELIQQAAKLPIPLLVGGPHATLYYDELQNDKRIDYIFIGESENTILKVVETAKKEETPQLVRSNGLVDPDKAPFPDFTSFFEYACIRSYPILTSRGCPFNCSFCPVHKVSSLKWRPRKIESVIEELKLAKKILSPHLHVLIQDDNAIVDKNRFKKFLQMYIDNKMDMRMAITNIRADSIDDELLILLKKAGCNSVGLGVESGNQEVFSKIHKGETLASIEKAAALVKKQGMLLSFCFVIGLPEDNLERVKDSIKLANKYETDSNYWNMATPYKGTEIEQWFKQHGKIYDIKNHTSFRDGDFRCDEPCAESGDFTREERKKAHYMAILGTADERLKLIKIPQLLPYIIRYGLYLDFISWLPRGIKKSLSKKIDLFDKGFKLYKREGLKQLLKQAYDLFKR